MRSPVISLVSLCLALLMAAPAETAAQSLSDGIFMNKKFLCIGAFYTHDSWKEYWEGTRLRTNGNIGTITTQNAMLGLNYGITDRLNVMAMTPFVWTKASAGTLTGLNGIQDLTLALKYNLWKFDALGGGMSVQVAAGGSLPLTDYPADFLPLSIGLQSKTLFGKAYLHYAAPTNFTFLLSGAYIRRSNITIDRNTYYTTEQVYSNKVEMPDAAQFSCRVGYYSFRWGAEATLDQNLTLGGFDIRRQDMPFPSNNMDVLRAGAVAFYRFAPLGDLQLIAGYSQVLTGRNVGKSTTWTVGLTKFLHFGPNENR